MHEDNERKNFQGVLQARNQAPAHLDAESLIPPASSHDAVHDAPDNAGKLVRITYRVVFDDGTVLLDQPDPIELPCDARLMPPALFACARTLAVGETNTAHVGADEAYEERSPERILRIERRKLPAECVFEKGAVMHLEGPDGNVHPARVIAVEDDSVTFDLNHDAVCRSFSVEMTLHGIADLPVR